MLRLVLGAAGSGKTSAINREIAEKITAGQRGICLIVPEQYSYDAERELCLACGDALSLGAEVLSFSRLAVRVAQEMGTGGKTSLDTGGRLLAMSLVLRQVSSRLRVFSQGKRGGRLPMEILKTIDELKAACLGYDDLVRASEKAGGELSLKLHDLALCLEAYDAVLARGRADTADRLTRLAETVAGSAVGRGGQIYIDGFTDFTGAETRVLEALIHCGADVTVCLTCDGLSGEDEHFAPARRTARALTRFANDSGQETQTLVLTGDADKNPALHFYDEHLFKYTSETASDPGGAINIFRCGDEISECENAAARCLALVRETGCRWRDIAIASRGFETYSAQLEYAFRLYGAPLFTARRGGIMQKSLPALVSGAFEVIFGGWERDDILSYMKTGLTGLERDDCDALESYLTMWEIKGGAWLKKSRWKQHPSGFGYEETGEAQALLNRINAIRYAVSEPLMRLAEHGAKAQTAAAQAQSLLDFLLEIKLPETLERRALELESSNRAQLADEFSQLWRVMCAALEQFAAILDEAPMEQEEFSELFCRMLSCYDVASIPLSPDAVTAGEIDRMRRRNIKHLIILGASDDRFPGGLERGGLLSEDDRAALEGLGLDALGNSEALSREFSLIYNCVTLPKESLALSYCAADSEGAAARPCFLISRARAMFDCPVRDVNPDVLRLSSRDSAFLLAARYDENANKACALAYEYFARSEDGASRIDDLRKRASLERGAISAGSVETLYGKTAKISPSRADAFFSCKYYYFLRYGLRLNEKESAGFAAPELGTYMHYVLEKCAAEISETTGFHGATPELAQKLADKYTDMYIAEALGGFEDKSERFVFLFNRLRASVRRVVADTVRELSRSDFAPLRFELSFGADGEMPPIRLSDGGLLISGTADRVDGLRRDGKLLLRVVDYKTGKKSFSLSDVWYGMGMQMLLYLFALEKGGRELFGGEIVPVGVMYSPATDAMISAPGDLTDEELTKERTKKLRRNGLLINDAAVLDAMERGDAPEYLPVKYKDGEVVPSDNLADAGQLELLKGHVERRLRELSDELSRGAIDAAPCYKSESDNACRFCPYAAVCRFDEGRDSRRYLKKLKAEEFWSRLEGGSDE